LLALTDDLSSACRFRASAKAPCAEGLANRLEEEPKMDVTVVEREAFKVVGVELTGADKRAYLIMYAWIALGPKLQLVKKQLRPHVLYGIWHRQPNADDHSYLVGVEVSEFTEVPDGMEAYTVPASSYAVFTHKGSVGRIPATYAKIREWLKESGAEHNEAATFEVYDTAQVISDKYEVAIHEPIKAHPKPRD
jgi:AraC family transcriptional regulator